MGGGKNNGFWVIFSGQIGLILSYTQKFSYEPGGAMAQVGPHQALPLHEITDLLLDKVRFIPLKNISIKKGQSRMPIKTSLAHVVFKTPLK